MSTNVTFLGVSDEIDTCECCGRSNLKRTVALRFDDDVDPVFYGTSCAGRTLGMTNTAVTNAAVNAQARVDADAALATELRGVYRSALDAFLAHDDGHVDLCRARRTYNNALPGAPRGPERYGMNFPQFMTAVAVNGRIPEAVTA